MTITQRVTFGAAALILTIPLMTACGNNAKDATSSAPARASQPVSPLTTAEKPRPWRSYLPGSYLRSAARRYYRPGHYGPGSLH